VPNRAPQLTAVGAVNVRSPAMNPINKAARRMCMAGLLWKIKNRSQRSPLKIPSKMQAYNTSVDTWPKLFCL
jgi:hypothetical protein